MELVTKKREVLGKKSATLRQAGLIPAELYGRDTENLHLTVSRRDFNSVLNEAGESTIVDLLVDGEKRPVLIHSVQYHPVTDEVSAVDFYQVRMDEVITADVEIDFIGESPALKKGGVVVKAVTELEAEALPKDLPHDFKVDLSRLENIGDVFKVKDLVIPSGVTLEAEPDTVIVSITEKLSEEEDQAQAAPADLEAITAETEAPKAAAADASGAEGPAAAPTAESAKGPEKK